MSAISLRLPNSIHSAAKELSRKEHVSINQFIMLAVSEKLSALGAKEFLEERAKRASKVKFLKVLKNAPDKEPDDYDKL